MNLRHKALSAAVLAALTLSPGAGIAAPSIPFTTKDDMVRVMATIDDGPPAPMLVDLGAGLDVLSSNAASRAHLKTDDVFTGWRMRGDPCVWWNPGRRLGTVWTDTESTA